MELSDDPEVSVQAAMKLLVEKKAIKPGDRLVVVSTFLAGVRLIDSVQMRVAE